MQSDPRDRESNGLLAWTKIVSGHAVEDMAGAEDDLPLWQKPKVSTSVSGQRDIKLIDINFVFILNQVHLTFEYTGNFVIWTKRLVFFSHQNYGKPIQNSKKQISQFVQSCQWLRR